MSFIQKKKNHNPIATLTCVPVRTLVLVVLKSYIAIFRITKYKNMATLVEPKPKPNNLAPQLILAMHISSKVKNKKKKKVFYCIVHTSLNILLISFLSFFFSIHPMLSLSIFSPLFPQRPSSAIADLA